MVADRYVLVNGEPARSPGQAVIRKAIDSRNGEFVAIKFLSAANDAVLKKIFDREVGTLSALQHPNIVRLHDSGIDDADTPYLVLEWVESSLIDTFRDRPDMSWDEFYGAIFAPLLEAVAHVHLADREHRDIKPGNVLIDAGGRVVLADFGIGKSRASESTTGVTVQQFRSGIYAPPELSDKIHFVRDVYSLAVVAIQAMTQRNIEDYHHLAPALESAAIPESVRELLRECIGDPIARPANARVLASRISDAQRQLNAAAISGSNKLSLVLTNSAKTQLSPSALSSNSAEVKVLDDLKSEVYAELRRDAESLTRDRSIIFLTGMQRRYTLRPDETESFFVVSGVTEPPFEELDNARRSGLRVDELFGFLLRKPLSIAAALPIAQGFRIELDRFYSRESYFAPEEPSEADAMLKTWSETLLVREEVTRKELGVLDYSEAKHSNRESTFTLSSALERDLFGSEWESPRSGSSGSWGVQGSVVRHDASRVIVRWQRDIDPTLFPAKGRVLPFMGHIQSALQRQKDALSSLRSGAVPAKNLRELLVDPSKMPEISLDSLVDVDELDEDKNLALNAALNLEGLMVVQGPPGTGKTRFIAELVRAYLTRNAGHRVLLVSQTHSAVDNALTRLESAGLRGLVRLGKKNDERVSPQNTHLLVEPLMEGWSGKLRARAEAYVEDLAADVGLEPRHLAAAQVINQLKVLIFNRNALERDISDLSDDDEVDAEGRVTVSMMYERLDAVQIEFDALIARAMSMLGSDLTMSLAPDVDELSDVLGALLPDGEHLNGLLEVMDIQAEWLQRIPSDPSLTAAFLSTSNVVAGTCLGFLSIPAIRQMEFDLCIFDEASRATATEAIVPLTRSKNAVLVGDLNQLPPLDEEVLAQHAVIAAHGLDRDAFEETLFKRLSMHLPSSARYSLRSQYRMVKPIGDLISEIFYEGELVSKREDSLVGYENIGAPVLWLSTSRSRERQERAAAGGGFVNGLEAREVLARLKSVDSSVERGVIESGKLSVLVISPYRSQVEELRRHIGSHNFLHLDIDIDSIDAVQGRECDLAILSLTRSNPSGNVGFLGKAYWRRINVALSRARFGLTIIGDSDFFAKTNSSFASVLKYMATANDGCEVRDLNG